MKIRLWAFLTVLFIAVFSLNTNAAILAGDRMVETPQHYIQQSDDQLIVVDYVFPGVNISQIENGEEIFDLIRLEGTGYMGTIGAPELPVLTKLFAIPDRARVKVKSAEPVYKTYQNISAYPHQEYEYGHPQNSGRLVIDETVYGKSAMFPEKWVTLGKPAIMRDLRIIPVNVYPVRVNPATGEIQVLAGLHLELEFEDGATENIKTRHFSQTVPTFNSYYANSIANYDWVTPNGVEAKGTLLVVYPNVTGAGNILVPWLNWKKRLGYNVIAEQVSNGASTTTVMNIIQQTYDTADPPLEHVALIGDAAGSFYIQCYTYSSGSTDHTYTMLEGGDIVADVHLGRISVSSTTQLQTAINKILYYEQNPLTFPNDWYKKGVVVAGSSNSGVSTIQVGRTVRDWWIEDGFTAVDTMWYTMGGSVPSFMNSHCNSGISALSFRGYISTNYWDEDDVLALNNPGKLPFGVIITCGTGNFGGSGCELSEAWLRAGTPGNPTGGIGGVGTATSMTKTRFNNTMTAGIWFGLYAENITQLGPMTFRGKLELFNTYQNDYNYLQQFTYWNNLMGDPTTDLWNDIPQTIVVNYDTEIAVGASSFSLTVYDQSENPLADRYITLWKGTETFAAGKTDENGVFTSAIDVPTEGTMLVTVSYHNDRPHLGNVDVQEMIVYPSFLSFDIDDDNSGSSAGNSDGNANPGETLELNVEIQNFGATNTATAVSATLSSPDEKVTVTNPTITYPNLSAGISAFGDEQFVVELAGDFPDGYIIPFEMTINSTQGVFNSAFDLEITSADITAMNAFFTANLLNPGESSDLWFTLRNMGTYDLTGVTAAFITEDGQVVVDDDSGTFGDMAAGAQASNSADPFTLSADEWATNGHPVEFVLHLTSENGFEQDVEAKFLIGEYHTSDPFGPDLYGYYCYDNTDLEYTGYPIYSYFDISGIGDQLNIPDYGNEQDASARVDLPFEFTYYGEAFEHITVCSNGWIGMGVETNHTDFRNYPIPTAFGPTFGMLCPYWDDLVMGSGHVYSHYDEENNRFIVEWHNIDHRSSGSLHYTFEAILYDPAHHPTPTGDGEIEFLYHQVTHTSGMGTDNAYWTTGIMSNDHLDGLEYAYWNSYHPAAFTLENGRVVKFTTIEPIREPQVHYFEMTLEPEGLPITIPSYGGNFDFYAEITNNGTTIDAADVWMDVTFPDASTSEPVFIRYALGVGAGVSFGRDMNQYAPGSAPAGDYTYNAYAGSYASGAIFSEDHFDFDKSGFDAASGGDWLLTGWEEESSSVSAIIQLPQRYELSSAAPNPFNPATDITFALPEAGNVKLLVFNTLGRQVAALADGWKAAGWYTATFDASQLSSGIYFYTLQSGDFVQTKKMLLVK